MLRKKKKKKVSFGTIGIVESPTLQYAVGPDLAQILSLRYTDLRAGSPPATSFWSRFFHDSSPKVVSLSDTGNSSSAKRIIKVDAIVSSMETPEKVEVIRRVLFKLREMVEGK